MLEPPVATAPNPTSSSRSHRRLMAIPAVLVAFVALFLPSPAAADAPAQDPDAAAFEVDFLKMMIDHHQMAVHMSELCLDRAVHDDLLALCEEIIASQAAEIEQMQGWLADWYGIEYEPSMDDPAHRQEIEHLQMLTGEEFEVAFLEMMVEHHAMAVAEAAECLREASHRELRRLCAGIISAQVREIVRMQVWLCRWYGDCDFRSPFDA